MIINTGKVISSSSILLNQAKENESAGKVSNINDSKKKLSGKLFTDLTETNYTENSVKSKFIAINNSLTRYENEMSRLQFADQKINELSQLGGSIDKNQISQFIRENTFNNDNVLEAYFPKLDSNYNNFENLVLEARKNVQSDFNALDKNFKKIEVTSQNLISLYSNKADLGGDNLKSINFGDLIKYSSIDKKKVLDLIS